MSDATFLPRNREDDGRYAREPGCDSCGKPCAGRGDDCGYMTDDDVCQGSDAPGFHLCYRKRCAKRYESLKVDQRRALFTRQRAENQLADNEKRRRRTVDVMLWCQNCGHRTPLGRRKVNEYGWGPKCSACREDDLQLERKTKDGD